MISTFTLILNGALIVAIFLAVRAWFKSKTVLLTYVKKLDQLDHDLAEVTRIRNSLVEQQKQMNYILTKTTQQYASFSDTSAENTAEDLFNRSATKRTLN